MQKYEMHTFILNFQVGFASDIGGDIVETQKDKLKCGKLAFTEKF